jgi:hypothetical protein
MSQPTTGLSLNHHLDTGFRSVSLGFGEETEETERDAQLGTSSDYRSDNCRRHARRVELGGAVSGGEQGEDAGRGYRDGICQFILLFLLLLVAGFCYICFGRFRAVLGQRPAHPPPLAHLAAHCMVLQGWVVTFLPP